MINSIVNVMLMKNIAMEIKYGKYCGIGYWGCTGEIPCDDADACCMGHDDCVGRFGTFYSVFFLLI